jgi:hypothetical protein
MRTADAVEKVTRKKPELLTPYKKELLGLIAEAEEAELRWHLAAMVPRLPFNSKERQRVASTLELYLADCSSIVKTFALQGWRTWRRVTRRWEPRSSRSYARPREAGHQQ